MSIQTGPDDMPAGRTGARPSENGVTASSARVSPPGIEISRMIQSVSSM
ncbi:MULTISPECIES: hypothetical protein [Roseovarius]|nr:MULTISPECIES: hypothetical protein [Roseovarius]